MHVEHLADAVDECAATVHHPDKQRKRCDPSRKGDNARSSSRGKNKTARNKGRESSPGSTMIGRKKTSSQDSLLEAHLNATEQKHVRTRVALNNRDHHRRRHDHPHRNTTPVNLRDSSEVWQRKSIKEKLSLSPLLGKDPLLEGLCPSWFMRMLSFCSENKSHKRSRSRHRHRHHCRQNNVSREHANMPEAIIPGPDHTATSSPQLLEQFDQKSHSDKQQHEQQHQEQIYSVLDQNIPSGEPRACAFDNKRVSPVSVAIARNASNVSRLTSRSCADTPTNCNSFRQSDDPNMAAPPEHSPPPISTVSTSPGCTESFTTARLFSGTMSPEPLVPRHNLAEIFDGGHPDEVSEIAMRNHLADARDSNEEAADTDDINIFTSDNETQSNYPSSDDNSIVDRAFHEWLQAQAAINDHPEAHSPFTTISQTASQSSATPPSRTMPTYAPGWAYMPPLYGGLSGSQQSHYSS
ncbi:hypothetical protein GGF37_004508, partial [Kickxella alabastrina]